MKYEIGTSWKMKNGSRGMVLADTYNGLLVWHCGYRGTFVYETDGTYINDDDFSLIEPWVEPKIIKGWINVYSGATSFLHKTKEDADGCSETSRLACIHIEVTEGEGL